MALSKSMTIVFSIGFAFNLLQYAKSNLIKKPH